MANQHSRQPIGLDGPGPFVTPTIEGCPNLEVGPMGAQFWAVLDLPDGKQLHLRLTKKAAYELHHNLKPMADAWGPGDDVVRH